MPTLLLRLQGPRSPATRCAMLSIQPDFQPMERYREHGLARRIRLPLATLMETA